MGGLGQDLRFLCVVDSMAGFATLEYINVFESRLSGLASWTKPSPNTSPQEGKEAKGLVAFASPQPDSTLHELNPALVITALESCPIRIVISLKVEYREVSSSGE